MASLYTEAWVVGPHKTSFYERRYEPAKGVEVARAVVLFVHGFPEHIGRYTSFLPQLSSADIAVCAFDQRGFGRTSIEKKTPYARTSVKEQMEDIEFFLRRCREWARPREVPLFLLGQSMGGFEVLTFVTSSRSPEAKKLGGVVALSPLIQLATPPPAWKRSSLGLVANVLPWMSIDSGVDPYKISSDRAVCEAFAADPLTGSTGTLKAIKSMLDGADELYKGGWSRWPEDLPLLVIHGTADEVTSQPASTTFFSKLPAKLKDKTYTTYSGGAHELMNEPHPMKERLAEEVVQWILARCPAEVRQLPPQASEPGQSKL